MEGINIWSGSDIGLGAALTNPTELAFRKGKLKNHYPVEFRGELFPDAEAAFKKFKVGEIKADIRLMAVIIGAKLEQHPRLFNAIRENGGVNWLKKCSHIVGVRGSRWEGKGLDSNFILALCIGFIYCQYYQD